jgi:hypothetical protein
MVVYKNQNLSVTSGSITGASAVTGVPVITVTELKIPVTSFYPWLPSTWPAAPVAWEQSLVETLREVFRGAMLNEIDNVIADAENDLRHRGHVVAIALLCALDAISSYGYGARNGKQIPEFVTAHFPAEYHPHGAAILKLYRHAMVHSWNLFGGAILPGDDPVAYDAANEVLSFGLLNFREALSKGLNDYLKKLETDTALQGKTLDRYTKLKNSAKP